jgi:hypothetical protein
LFSMATGVARRRLLMAAMVPPGTKSLCNQKGIGVMAPDRSREQTTPSTRHTRRNDGCRTLCSFDEIEIERRTVGIASDAGAGGGAFWSASETFKCCQRAGVRPSKCKASASWEHRS